MDLSNSFSLVYYTQIYQHYVKRESGKRQRQAHRETETGTQRERERERERELSLIHI